MQNIKPSIKLPGQVDFKEFELIYKSVEVPNVHVIHVEFTPGTLMNPKRVSIKSLRFIQTVHISAYIWPSELLQDIAQIWLTAMGFNLLGCGEGKTGFYFFTNTFKPLK